MLSLSLFLAVARVIILHARTSLSPILRKIVSAFSPSDLVGERSFPYTEKTSLANEIISAALPLNRSWNSRRVRGGEAHRGERQEAASGSVRVGSGGKKKEKKKRTRDFAKAFIAVV